MAAILHGLTRCRVAWSIRLKTMFYFIGEKNILFIMHYFVVLKLDSLHYEPERGKKAQKNSIFLKKRNKIDCHLLNDTLSTAVI
jgi:hypothetical protein